jgi:hypothetical protein
MIGKDELVASKIPSLASQGVAAVDETTMNAFSLLKDFQGFFPPSERRIHTALQHGLVAVDANVLLDLYLYEESGTQDWFKAFHALGDRFWMPRQSVDEFWRIRANKAAYPEKTTHAISQINQARNKILKEFNAWTKSRGAKPSETEQQQLTEVDELVTSLLSSLESFETSHAERFDVQPEKDEIVQGLVALMNNPDGGARLGDGYTAEELERLYVKGAERYAEEIPPGFRDDAKNSNPKQGGKDGVEKYGDWVIWAELLEEARRFKDSNEADVSYVVFITNDQSNDWWQTHPVGKNQHSQRSAHPSLTREMKQVAGCEYIQLRPEPFLHHIKGALNLDFREDTLRSTAAVTEAVEDDESWLPGLFSIRAQGETRAHAKIKRDGSCLVLKGSRASATWTATFSESQKRRVTRLIDEGILTPGTTHDDYEFTEDHWFTSPSAASDTVLGANSSGNEKWYDEDGTRLGTIRAQLPQLEDQDG